MQHVFVKAVFNGKDGSLGYKHGETYYFTYIVNSKGEVLIISNMAECEDCLYSNSIKFLENWGEVSISK